MSQESIYHFAMIFEITVQARAVQNLKSCIYILLNMRLAIIETM